jgi:hypothetical protein
MINASTLSPILLGEMVVYVYLGGNAKIFKVCVCRVKHEGIFTICVYVYSHVNRVHAHTHTIFTHLHSLHKSTHVCSFTPITKTPRNKLCPCVYVWESVHVYEKAEVVGVCAHEGIRHMCVKVKFVSLCTFSREMMVYVCPNDEGVYMCTLAC